MRSATAISYELDNIEAAAKELVNQIKGKLTFGKHTAAILQGQPDMELGELSAAISRELGCHVIGGTTAAGAVLTNEGLHELAVVLHVMSADDCLFAAAISGSMETEPQKEIKDIYQRAYRSLKEQDPSAEPQLVICVAPIVQSLSSDCVLDELSRVSGGLPIFGYIAADDFEFCKQQIFLDGEAGSGRLAVLLISGNVRPIFQVENLSGRRMFEKCLVTKARDNIIYEIDDKPAYEYIKNFPFIDDQTKALWNHQFFVEMRNAENNDGIAVSRALNTYSKETGEITCFADVPQDSYIGLLYCDGNDVAISSENALKNFADKLDAAGGGYEYSTVFIVSCSLRNMFLADQKSTEGDLVKKLLPPNLTVSGLYAFGEIAPTSVRDNKATNRFHNATFVLCAF